jgi:hypothetical protein
MPIMNMACSNAVEVGFAAVSKPDTWSMPFLLRATPRLDLAGWTLRSEVNHDGDRAFERHTRPDPERYEYRNVIASHPPSGRYVRDTAAPHTGRTFGDDRLADFLMRASLEHLPVNETVRHLADNIHDFADEGLRDDATMLLLEHHPAVLLRVHARLAHNTAWEQPLQL